MTRCCSAARAVWSPVTTSGEGGRLRAAAAGEGGGAAGRAARGRAAAGEGWLPSKSMGSMARRLLDLDGGRNLVCVGNSLRRSVLMDIADEGKRQSAWDDILLKNEQIVFARVTPAHKLLIVENNQVGCCTCW